MQAESARVLLVDDDPVFLRDMTDLLQTYLHGLDVVTAGDGAQGLDVLETTGADLVISDRHMPRMDGLAFLAAIQARFPLLPRILITGHTEGTKDAKACEVIAKPPAPEKTVDTVRRLLALGSDAKPCGKSAPAGT